MNLSKTTMNVLSNFTKVNQSIIVDEKNTIKTVNPSNSIVAVYDTEETFEKEFALYNLQEFMSVLSMFDMSQTEVEITDMYAVITSVIDKKKQSVKYRFASKEVLECKDKIKKSSDYKKAQPKSISFQLTKDELKKLTKVSAVMGLPHLQIVANDDTDGKVVLTLMDKKNSSENNYCLEIDGEGSGSIMIETDSLLFLDGTYNIKVEDKKYIKAENVDMPLFYIVTALL